MYEGWEEKEEDRRPEGFFENLHRLRRRGKAARMLLAHEVDRNGLKAKHGSELSQLRSYLEDHYRLGRTRPAGEGSDVWRRHKADSAILKRIVLCVSEKEEPEDSKDFKDDERAPIFEIRFGDEEETHEEPEDALGEVERRQLDEMFEGVVPARALGRRVTFYSRASLELRSFIENRDQSFSETLLALIEKKGMTNSQCYRAAQVDRKLFSKIRKDPLYVPAKPTALALIMALRLDIREAEALLAKAGYALSRASVFDLAVRYFIENEMYDVLKANEMLYALDQRLLGGRWK